MGTWGDWINATSCSVRTRIDHLDICISICFDRLHVAMVFVYVIEHVFHLAQPIVLAVQCSSKHVTQVLLVQVCDFDFRLFRNWYKYFILYFQHQHHGIPV